MRAPHLLRPAVFAGNDDGKWLALHTALQIAGSGQEIAGRITSIGQAISFLEALAPDDRKRLEAAITTRGGPPPEGPQPQVEHTTKIMVVGGWDPASAQDAKLEHTTPHVMTRWMDDEDFKRAPITVFKKFPTGIAAPGAALALPPVSLVGSAPVSGRYVADAALAVVIGRPALRVSPADAHRHVFGATLMLDVWNDDVFVEEARVRRGMVARNLTALSPIGPCIESCRDGMFGDDQEISLRVDGNLRQRFTLGALVHSIADVISYCSSVGLTPGDVIAFGARIAKGAGTGPLDTPTVIRPGQAVEVTADGLATLRADVVAGPGYVIEEGAA
jgi:2-keto-4-pentenoate hydratase/2-oxohepta-3-ene-1,7-dioic acid hydratase in catechol pathway